MGTAVQQVVGTTLCQGPEAGKMLVHMRKQKEGQCNGRPVRKGQVQETWLRVQARTVCKILNYVLNIRKAVSTSFTIVSAFFFSYVHFNFLVSPKVDNVLKV